MNLSSIYYNLRLTGRSLGLSVVILLFVGTESFADENYPLQLDFEEIIDGETHKQSLQHFAGKPLLLSFFFTHCPVACPTQTAHLRATQRNLPNIALEHSRFLSLSIDPKRDTAEKIHAFTETHDINTQHWRFGRTEDMDALHSMMNSLAVTVEETEEDGMDHKMVVFLIDASGRIVQRYIGTALNKNRVAADLLYIVSRDINL